MFAPRPWARLVSVLPVARASPSTLLRAHQRAGLHPGAGPQQGRGEKVGITREFDGNVLARQPPVSCRTRDTQRPPVLVPAMAVEDDAPGQPTSGAFTPATAFGDGPYWLSPWLSSA